MRICVFAAITLAGLSMLRQEALAQDYFASFVEPADGVVECNWARDRIITVIRSNCDDFARPKQVRLGETFSANGYKKTIGIILATRIEKDMPKYGMKAGDWYCAAGESKSDLPTLSGKREHTGTWLYIPKCIPVQ